MQTVYCLGQKKLYAKFYYLVWRLFLYFIEIKMPNTLVYNIVFILLNYRVFFNLYI